jgi:putative two-component system response regulator
MTNGSVVLVVDDISDQRDRLAGLLESLGHDVRQARDGMEALASVEAEEPDLVLLDIDMPRMDGLSACRLLKEHPRRRLIPVVLMAGSADRETRLAGLAAGADDLLSEPFDARELLIRTRVLLRERSLNKRLDASTGVIHALARAIEARDLYMLHHAERVAATARELGRLHGLGDAELPALHEGALLHDLGKIAIPDSILLKPGKLTTAELQIMRTHSAEGERIALPLRSVSAALPVIRHHHERFDGAGYPDHLAGAEIPFGARATAVGDGWDAMTNDRAYRRRLETDEALARLKGGAGSQWDPALVDSFVHLLESGRLGRLVAAEALQTAV